VDRERIHRLTMVAPIMLSLAALALALAAVRFGWERGAHDEGAVAHTWQLLMAAQAPLIALFLVTADARQFRREITWLAVLAAAFVLALAPVAILRL
jgi:hypothetical protein